MNQRSISRLILGALILVAIIEIVPSILMTYKSFGKGRCLRVTYVVFLLVPEIVRDVLHEALSEEHLIHFAHLLKSRSRVPEQPDAAIYIHIKVRSDILDTHLQFNNSNFDIIFNTCTVSFQGQSICDKFIEKTQRHSARY